MIENTTCLPPVPLCASVPRSCLLTWHRETLNPAGGKPAPHGFQIASYVMKSSSESCIICEPDIRLAWSAVWAFWNAVTASV